jgi:hypothetical protein
VGIGMENAIVKGIKEKESKYAENRSNYTLSMSHLENNKY